jgi:hypothetical protein
MSQIHFRDVSLEDLVSRAPVAVVVRLADPPQRNEHVAVAQVTHDGKRCPDFVRPLTRLEVVESLTKGGPAAGDVIEVESANASARLRMHTEYYVRGLSRSPVYSRFEGAPLDRTTPVIALLQPVGKHFAWVVDVSTVPLAQRALVERNTTAGGAIASPTRSD